MIYRSNQLCSRVAVNQSDSSIMCNLASETNMITPAVISVRVCMTTLSISISIDIIITVSIIIIISISIGTSINIRDYILRAMLTNQQRYCTCLFVCIVYATSLRPDEYSSIKY